MKRFSDIRAINEHEGIGPFTTGPNLRPVDTAIDGPDGNAFDVSHPESIQRINAYLHSLSHKPCIDPNYVLRFIQSKMAILGFYFSYPKKRPFRYEKTSTTNVPAQIGVRANDEASYSVVISPEEFPLSFMGGRSGVLDNNHTIGKDDGIRNRIGRGLKIKFAYSLINGGLVYVIPTVVLVD